MTLVEIFNTICRIVTGDIASSRAADTDQVLIQTLILNYHHQLQTQYNYWFQRYRGTLSIISGTSTYALPATYKEFISLDYDSSFEFIGNNIVFDEEPSETKDVQFDYWQYIATPAWVDTYTDAVTQYLHFVLIYTVAAEMFVERSEMTQAQMYYALRDQSLDAVKDEDYRRRQSINEIF